MINLRLVSIATIATVGRSERESEELDAQIVQRRVGTGLAPISLGLVVLHVLLRLAGAISRAR